MSDWDRFAETVLGTIKGVRDALTVRIEALEKREPLRGEPGEKGADGLPGRDAEPVTKQQIIEAVLTEPGALDSAVSSYLAQHPPANGKDGIMGPVGERGETGPKGLDGTSLRAGIGTPTLSGISGDVYIDAKTGDIYQWS